MRVFTATISKFNKMFIGMLNLIRAVGYEERYN